MEEFKKPSLPSEKILKEEIKPIGKEAGGDLQKITSVTTNKTPVQVSPYKVPKWSKQPNDNRNYSFEVLKSGQIIDEVKSLECKAYWSFGRLPENDIEMAHPTISRFHAILQYRPGINTTGEKDDEQAENKPDDISNVPAEGWYIFDLDSTHGTFVNKQRIPPKIYIRIRVGHILRLGASTRSYILQGPSEDEEPESELTITELKAKRQRDIEEALLERKRLAEEAEEIARNEGCGWGMGDDADVETDLTHNPYASTNNEELFLDDPKKTLRGYFEREGLQLEYKCDEMSAGSFVCRVELPLDNENGRPIIAEVVHKGKKKDCVVQCALEACRILDRHGVLRQANQEPLKRKQKLKDSDSDDDEFWDRTGDIARKKQRKTNVSTTVTLTYEDLLKQELDLNEQLSRIEASIVDYQNQQKLKKAQKEHEEQGEDLDSYMENLQSRNAPMDKTEIKKLRLEEQRLKTELQRNQRLLKIAKPIDMPFTTNPLNCSVTKKQLETNTMKRQLPMIGKRNQFSKFKVIKPTATAVKLSKTQVNLPSDEEEIEEDDNDEAEIKGEVVDNTKATNIPIGVLPQNNDKSKDNENTKESLENIEQTGAPSTKADIRKETNLESTEVILEQIDEPSVKCENNLGLSESRPDNISTINITSECGKNRESEDRTSATLHSIAGESGKKRRHRNRQRGKRQEVDINDDIEYESTEKYAKWVPPENQTGDGFTELNKKYGY